ncbi:MAG: hypothetical protein ACYS9X_23960, partial [Planctomycetota bacterium]
MLLCLCAADAPADARTCEGPKARGRRRGGAGRVTVVWVAALACSCSRLPATYLVEAGYDYAITSFVEMSTPVELRTSTSSLTVALKPVPTTNGPVAEMLFLARVPHLSLTYNDTELPDGWLDGNGPWEGVGLHHADGASPLTVGMWFEEAEPVPSGCITNRSRRLGGAVGLAFGPGLEAGISYEEFSFDGLCCFPDYKVETWELYCKSVRAVGPAHWVNVEGGVSHQQFADRYRSTQARL